MTFFSSPTTRGHLDFDAMPGDGRGRMLAWAGDGALTGINR